MTIVHSAGVGISTEDDGSETTQLAEAPKDENKAKRYLPDVGSVACPRR
jgi:hypothetical protein